MSRQSFISVRSYYFREQCARVDRDRRQFGGRSLDQYDLDDFRRLWSIATRSAIDAVQASLNKYNPATRQWDRPFRRIER